MQNSLFVLIILLSGCAKFPIVITKIEEGVNPRIYVQTSEKFQEQREKLLQEAVRGCGFYKKVPEPVNSRCGPSSGLSNGQCIMYFACVSPENKNE